MTMSPEQEETTKSLKRLFLDVASDHVTEEVNKKPRRVSNNGAAFTGIPAGVAEQGCLPKGVSETMEKRPPRILYQQSQVKQSGSAVDKQLGTSTETNEPMPYRISPAISVLDLTKTAPETRSLEMRKVNSVDGIQQGCLSDVHELEEKLRWELDTELASAEHRSSETGQRPSSWAAPPRRRSSLSGRRASLMEHKRRKSVWAAAVMFLLVLLVGNKQATTEQVVDPNSVFVSGGGFSGFWFSIGRLQSIEDPASKTYYCYSAGCIAVVAVLSNSTVDEMSDLCFGVQNRWKVGETRHYGVVTDFLDNFLSTPNVRELLRNEELLSKIHIITAVRNDWFGLKSSIRSPSGSEDLYRMLLQTTWIPFATAERLWEADSSTGEYNMDGIFSTHDHPVCAHQLDLPWKWDLRVNGLNVNLGPDKVVKFWNEGLEYGL